MSIQKFFHDENIWGYQIFKVICIKELGYIVKFIKMWLYLFSFFQHSDMMDEMKTETMELCVTACEKFSNNNEVSM